MKFWIGSFPRPHNARSKFSQSVPHRWSCSSVTIRQPSVDRQLHDSIGLVIGGRALSWAASWIFVHLHLLSGTPEWLAADVFLDLIMISPGRLLWQHNQMHFAAQLPVRTRTCGGLDTHTSERDDLLARLVSQSSLILKIRVSTGSHCLPYTFNFKLGTVVTTGCIQIRVLDA